MATETVLFEHAQDFFKKDSDRLRRHFLNGILGTPLGDSKLRHVQFSEKLIIDMTMTSLKGAIQTLQGYIRDDQEAEEKKNNSRLVCDRAEWELSRHPRSGCFLEIKVGFIEIKL